MNTIILSVAVIVSIIGISVACWSFIQTRNKFYKEFKSRKKKND